MVKSKSLFPFKFVAAVLLCALAIASLLEGSFDGRGLIVITLLTLMTVIK